MRIQKPRPEQGCETFFGNGLFLFLLERSRMEILWPKHGLRTCFGNLIRSRNDAFLLAQIHFLFKIGAL